MNDVRRAGPADIPEIVRLKELLMVDGWPWDVQLDDAWRVQCADVARELMAKDSYACFVIDADEENGDAADGAPRLAACVTVSIEQHLPGPDGSGRSAYIGDMCTDVGHRGRGLGTELLGVAMDWAREQGAGWASLFSTESGRALYVAAGFDPQGPFEHLSIGLD